MKKIPLKNYLILVLLLAVSSIIVLYFINWYKEFQRHTSILPEYISEIKYVEIDNYIIENPDFVIFLSSKENNKTTNLEKNLKNWLVSKNLIKKIIFMDIDQFDIKQFSKKYCDDFIKTKKDVMVIVVENQKVKNILSKSANEIKIDDIKEFLKENGVN